MRFSSIAVIAVAFAAACGGGETPAGDTSAAASSAAPATTASAASGSDCVAGTYTQPSPSFSPKFVFNADGTGEETQAESQGGQTRKFTWKTKDANQLTITFPAEGSQRENSTDWAYNCEGKTFANMYKKQ
jgi:hypothetical protein